MWGQFSPDTDVRKARSLTTVWIMLARKHLRCMQKIKSQCFIVSEQSNCISAPWILFELKLSGTASFSISLLCSSLLLPCYFNAVVRDDLNFFHQFHFLFKLVTFIYFLLFLWEKLWQVLPNCILSATQYDVCLCACVKMKKKARNDFPILLTGNGCKENMWL